MKPEKLYEIFTEALGNENIRAELTDMIAAKLKEDRIDGQTELFPQNDASALAAENAALSRKIALLELESGRLANENAELTSQLMKCKELLREYYGAYGTQIALYEKYNKLSENTRRVLRGIFKNDSLSKLFICGAQLENLKSLRDYTEQLVIDSFDEMSKDIAVLDELYTYLLSCYNSTFTKPVYAIMSASCGDSFDEMLHHNVDTARSGNISAVLLRGCKCVSSGKIIRKSIVKI